MIGSLDTWRELIVRSHVLLSAVIDACIHLHVAMVHWVKKRIYLKKGLDIKRSGPSIELSALQFTPIGILYIPLTVNVREAERCW